MMFTCNKTLVDDSSEHTSESSVDGFGLSELLVLVPHAIWTVHVTTLVDDLSELTSESSVDGFGLSELLVLVASTVIHICYGQFL